MKMRLCFKFSAILSLAIVINMMADVTGSRFDPRNVKALGKPPSSHFDLISRTEYYGYKSQRHDVVTQDGYILALYRIGQSRGPPVLFVNGWNITPIAWVLHGPGRDLALVLADLGYDVWLGSQRAVVGSFRHTKWNYKRDKEYCDSFSLNELGAVDLPAQIDFILSRSEHNKTFYVGSSLGGTTIVIMCSELPDYCSSNIAGTILLSPAMQIPQINDLPPFTNSLANMLSAIVHSIRDEGASWFAYPFDKQQVIDMSKTFAGINFLYVYFLKSIGYKREHMADGWLGLEISTLVGTAFCTRQYIHILQVLFSKEGGLRKYDYGRERNMEVYGHHEPPDYNVSRLSPPTVVVYTEGDELVPKKVMLRSMKYLPNLELALRVDDKYGHTDVILGHDQYMYYYTQVVDFMDNISGID